MSMDPIQIASAAAGTAKVAWSVGEALYHFFHDVKVIDQTVAGLIAEVKALSGACTLVDERLRDIVHDFGTENVESSESRKKLWACVEAQVVDSQKSVDQLQTAIAGLVKDGTNPFAQAWRQIKLNMQAKDIGEARNRIRSHTASLQTILQTVAIELCYLAPKRADQQLRTLLTRTEECMEQLRALRMERADVPDKQQAGEEDVLQLSERVTSDGESLYTQSQANGSLFDRVLGVGRGVNISEWMQDISAIDALVSRSTSVAHRSDTGSHSARSSTAPRANQPLASTSDRKSTILSHNMIIEDDGSDDEMLSELALEALSSGKSFFAANDYLEASSYLREALKIVRELPAKRQKICDTWDLRFMLSVCAYHNLELIECESDLIGVIDSASELVDRTDEQLLHLCEAGYLLAQVCIRLNKLDSARLYCDNALQGRRRLLGKNHVEYYKSVALVARVYELQGSDTRAKIYLRTIPEDERESYKSLFHELAPQENIPPTVTPTDPSPASAGSQPDANDALGDNSNASPAVADSGDPRTVANEPGPKQRKRSMYNPARWMPFGGKKSSELLSGQSNMKQPSPLLGPGSSSEFASRARREASVASDTTSLSSNLSGHSSNTMHASRDIDSVSSVSDMPPSRSIWGPDSSASTLQTRTGLYGRRASEATAPASSYAGSVRSYTGLNDTSRRRRKETEYFDSKAQTAGLLRMSPNIIQGIRNGEFDRGQVDEMIGDRAKAIRNSSLTAVLIADKHKALQSSTNRDKSIAQLHTNYGPIHIALRSDFAELDEGNKASVQTAWSSLLTACSKNLYINIKFQRRHLDQWSAYGVFGASTGTNHQGAQFDLLELLPELASAHFNHVRVGDIVLGGEVSMAILEKRSGLTTTMGDARILRSDAVFDGALDIAE